MMMSGYGVPTAHHVYRVASCPDPDSRGAVEWFDNANEAERAAAAREARGEIVNRREFFGPDFHDRTRFA